MDDEKLGHLVKLTMSSFAQSVSANPRVPCTMAEVGNVLCELRVAVNNGTYKMALPRAGNEALSDDFVFDKNDTELVLKDLSDSDFVGKIKDVSKGGQERVNSGLPQEYLYVFQYPCSLMRRDWEESGIRHEKVLIYIKINNRTIPYRKVFIVSFHKNR